MGKKPRQTKARKKTMLAIQRRAMVSRLQKKKIIDASEAAHIIGMKLKDSFHYIKTNILKKVGPSVTE